jgi:hypothetical protein
MVPEPDSNRVSPSVGVASAPGRFRAAEGGQSAPGVKAPSAERDAEAWRTVAFIGVSGRVGRMYSATSFGANFLATRYERVATAAAAIDRKPRR